MRKVFIAMTLGLLALSTAIPSFSQGLYSAATGTVTDASGALIPGVEVKATNVDTGVSSTTVTNETGSYNFPSLLPGKYTITASLPGFQTETIKDANLSQNTTNRFNFKLNVANANTQVEVTVSAETILSQQGGTVGQSLNQQTVQNLPIVGNNVLDLITVMAGVENVVATDPPSASNAFGRENTTFAGVRADNVMIVRDGIDMNDNRSPNGIYSITTINPDLVGEVRLILAPVDVENGRGNGSIQYTTRSGTNQFRGSAVYSFRNNSLDPNTWSNNRSQTVPLTASPSLLASAQAGKANLALQPNWNNTIQGTVSFGGPIIKNKTFFFGLFDLYTNHQRELDNFQVPTACQRLGIVRYFNGWNPTNALGTNNLTSAATPTLRAVDLNGNPVTPTTAAPGANAALDFTTLQSRSIFGTMQSMPTKADCSDAAVNTTTLVPNGVSLTAAPGSGAGVPYDAFRRQLDPSGFIAKMMALQYSPLPNNWEVGDGLNTAGYRILRHFTGLDNLFGSGEATGNRKQYNVKIDHNFNARHKGNVNFTYERTVSDDVLAPLPAGMSDSNFRHPIVISAGFVSTLSPTLLNEARFGYRLQDLNVISPIELPQYQNQLKALLPSPINGIKILPFFGFGQFPANVPCPAYYGSRPGASSPLPGTASGACNIAPTSKGKTPTWTYADTVSWTHKNHSVRFSGEYRYNSSSTITPGTSDFTGTSTYIAATIGSVGITAPGTTGANDFSNSNTRPVADPNNLLGLGTTLRGNSINYMNYLAGSLSNVAMQYYINSPKLSSPPSINDWKSIVNGGELLTIKVIQKEFSAWVKDDWKVKPNLTLTPGLRWDYTGVPYLDDGTTTGLVGGGGAAFGLSGRDFSGWLNPNGRGAPTSIQFVGPGSPNSGQGAYPAIYSNFGPAFAFVWSPKMFGEGKTTIRGGYQITYSTGSPQPGTGRFSSYSGALSGAPGRTTVPQAATLFNGSYLDLTTGSSLNPNNLSTVVPALVPNAPPASTALYAPQGPRNAALSVFDPNYKTPYVQNLTLSVTRQLNRTLTLDVRYIGTLSRHSYATQNLNLNNFTTNGLLKAFEAARRGDDANTGLLDQMFAGINLCTSTANVANGNCAAGTWGPINGTTQRAAAQMRSSSTFAGNLANANYGGAGGLANTIANFNYAWAPASGTNCVNCTLQNPNPDGQTVGSALRLNQFPENFIWTNPQFSTVTYYTNWGWNNYHSLQAQITMRPTNGMSGTATWNWSKNLGLGTLTDPTNRHQDYTNVGGNPGQELRMNGLFELPLGPNKFLLGNSHGFIARAVEKWQLGLIYNLFQGSPTDITTTALDYGNGVPDVRHAVDFNKISGVRWGIKNGNFLEGRFFDNNNVFTAVPDPQCLAVTTQQNLFSATGPTGTPRCTLQALAMVVPQGTPDSGLGSSYGLPSTSAYANQNVQIVLQHPQPGVKGSLGNNPIRGLGSYRFDANFGKTFKVAESRSLVIRFDALNVLNHPVPSNPNVNIDSTTAPFGQLATKGCGASGQCRALQGQLRFNF
jgi:hypothetical protein